MAGLIQAASVRVQTMADDSLRLVVDIEPHQAREAFDLFGQRGVPMVLARLTPEAAQASARQQVQQQAARPSGGEVSKWLAMRGQEPEFQEFVRRAYDKHLGGDGSGTGDVAIDEFEDMADFARHCVLVLCECEESRAEIDNDERKRQLWRDRVREPWRVYLQAMGRRS